MPLCGIDLHSGNCQVVVLDEKLATLVERRQRNELGEIVELLEPHREELVGIAVESTRNWYPSGKMPSASKRASQRASCRSSWSPQEFSFQPAPGLMPATEARSAATHGHSSPSADGQPPRRVGMAAHSDGALPRCGASPEGGSGERLSTRRRRDPRHVRHLRCGVDRSRAKKRHRRGRGSRLEEGRKGGESVNGLLRVVSAYSVLAVGATAALVALPGWGILYGTDGRAGNLLTIDPATGAGTVVGPIASGQQIRSLATDPATGILYAGTGGNQSRLYRVDPATGAGTLVGDTGFGHAMISALDFGPDGRLHASVNLTGSGGTGGDHLVTIDTATGAATLIGSFGICTGVTIPSTGSGSCTIEGIEGLAFDTGGRLWGVLRGSGQSAGTPGLYRIDLATAQATFAVPVQDASGEDILTVALQYSCDGTLFGGAGGAGSPIGEGNPTPPKPYVGFLSIIDPTSGLLTFVGGSSATGGSDDLSGLAFAGTCGALAIPALAPLPLVLLGLLLAAAGWLTLTLRLAPGRQPPWWRCP